MPSHAFHLHNLLRNVAVEVIYENNPVFAGENVSVIIRFKHLGEEEQPKEVEESSDTQNGTDKQGGNGEAGQEWFGKRLSVQLSNSARSLFMEDFNKSQSGLKKENEFNKPVDLFSGYVQLSGVFTYNDTVIDHDKFDEIHKKTTISGKIGGLQGLEISKQENANFFNLLSGFFNSDIQAMAKHEDELNNNSSHTSKLFEDTKNLIPFFSTNQSLLFSLINLKPNQVKSFYVNFKLPSFLPPTYNGNSIKINYKLIIGSSIDSKDGFPKPLVINFPLNISSFFNKKGYQPVYNLNKFILLQAENSFVEEIEDKISFKQLKKRIESNALMDNLSLVDKREIFMNRIKDLQKNNDNNEDTIDNFKKSKIKDNISQFSELQASSQSDSSEQNGVEQSDDSNRLIQIDGFPYERQINKFQTQYSINRNGKFVTSLTFSKPFYKVGGSVKLHFNFKPSESNIEAEKVTGILISLENLELISNNFAIQETLISSNNSDSVVHYRESFSTFNSTQFSVNIPIPINSTSQFKTNIFESKWSLVLKFVIANEDSLMVQAHKDNSGVLTFAKESLGGVEFNCRLPLFVIPSDQEFGGIPL